MAGKMRVITGKYKGKAILMPEKIRPTQNKVRKALFDILGDIEGLSFLELFAGSGAVGFEAASRGISRLVMVESDRSCAAVIEKNIQALQLGICRLLPKDAAAALKILQERKEKFDLVFLDPPYYRDLAKKILQMLGAYDILAPYGLVVVQHFKNDGLPENEGGLTRFRESKYGDTLLSFYRKDQ